MKDQGDEEKTTLFQPGQSGNPKGRPRGLGIKAVLKHILEEPLPAAPNMMTVGERLIEIAIDAAANGDSKFFTTLMKHADDVPVHHEVNQSLRVIREVSGLDEAAILGESKDG